jgi:alkanesulfonate monooxygenase SsuD/methylene tetrahydromethanopterin reductase-like flavin-dependent oxidoreductase (luciferase family)
METRGEVILRAAELADEHKYEFFSVAEGWGFDCTTPLASVCYVSNR